MAKTPETNKPDFRNGFPIRDLRDRRRISGQADGEESVLGVAECSPTGAYAKVSANTIV
ncbi:MAG: hypothetical protein WBV55_11505 [Candidatus Sulfotelmatobacter sp.]